MIKTWILREYSINISEPKLAKTYLKECAKELYSQEISIKLFGEGLLPGFVGVEVFSDKLKIWLPDSDTITEQINNIVDCVEERFNT